MLAEIITIGDEILIGQTVDTNSAWLGKELNKYGIEVIQITSINDRKENILRAIKGAESRVDLIIITGGLGPTKDDITKKTLAEYFNTTLVPHQESLENIERIFNRRGQEIIQANIDQSLVPQNCSVILNTKGTAPGMFFEENEKIYISLPGVPYEMKAMMENVVFEKLDQCSDNYTIVHKTYTVVGIPESHLSESLSSVEDNLPPHIKLAYLPHLNLIRLRLSGRSNTLHKEDMLSEIESIFDAVRTIVGDKFFEGELSLGEVIGTLLSEDNKTIGTIESCSGGFLAHQLTTISGSSRYYKGSLLTYAYETKVAVADIEQTMLNQYGAVSEEVCRAMVTNAQKKLDVDYCISTTGIAGPSGGTPDKPVGLVYIGLALPNGEVEVKKCVFRGSRIQVIQRTAITAFEMVRIALRKG